MMEIPIISSSISCTSVYGQLVLGIQLLFELYCIYIYLFIIFFLSFYKDFLNKTFAKWFHGLMDFLLGFFSAFYVKLARCFSMFSVNMIWNTVFFLKMLSEEKSLLDNSIQKNSICFTANCKVI